VVERITIIEFGMNDGGGNGARCGGMKLRTDTTKLSNYNGNSKLWRLLKFGQKR